MSKFLNPVSILALVAFAGFSVYIVYSNISFANDTDEDLYQLLTTNQTHVATLKCDKLETAIKLGDNAVFFKPVKTLPVLKQIAIEKNCDFVRDLKP